MDNKVIKGNLCAAYSALIWGTTFIVTKNLMADFNAAEILLSRFIVALLCLAVMGFVSGNSIFAKTIKSKDELFFVVTGLTGLVLYGVLEIISMQYTFTANTSTIVSTNPFFIALFAVLILKEEKPSIWFFLGFVLSIAGIAIISFNGVSSFGLNPLGDLLALAAALCWGIYTTFIRIAANKGYSNIFITGRTYLWGSLFMALLMPVFGFNTDFARFADSAVIFSIIYLGVFASGSCFLAWNYATKQLGPVNSAVYIYTIPVVTVIFSRIFLNEKLNFLSVLGVLMVLLGTVASKKKQGKV